MIGIDRGIDKEKKHCNFKHIIIVSNQDYHSF